MRTRRSRLVEKRTRKTIILTSLGILVIIFLLFKFGTNILVGFSMFLAGTKNQQISNTNSDTSFVPAPILNPLSSATNSAQIAVSGKAQPDTKIYLFINDNNVDKTEPDKNGNFSFNNSVSLGENQIKVRAQKNDKFSDFSDSFTITYKNSAPFLSIESPSDGQSFSKDQNSVVVKGKTDANVTVTVNGFWAIINDTNNYSYNLTLQNGDNQIKVIATDLAGNKTEKDLKVIYSQ